MLRGRQALDREDPVRALELFRKLRQLRPDGIEPLLGLGEVHMLQGHPRIAESYADAVLGRPRYEQYQPAVALLVRAMLRDRRFRPARDRARQALGRIESEARDPVGADMLAAYASALFRTQETDRAASFYQQVLEEDALHEEAHVRLGSGLTPPRKAVAGPACVAGIRAAREGRLGDAVEQFVRALTSDPGNPIAHRLLGEALFSARIREGMASRSEAYAWLRRSMPRPSIEDLPVSRFMPQFDELGLERREVATRALALFGSRLPRLVTLGGRHDLLLEDERTTDALSRSSLRGRRTFDGRVWDDVRGVGGLRAATGIEALDDAAIYGFDTLSHEIAHQVHLYAFPRRLRNQITRMYERAKAERRFLDYYAASNEAEYFGQGVEAFVCLGKRPSYEATHGHTRWELMRVDPELYALIAREVDFDPLRPDGPDGTLRPEQVELLRAAVAVALRSGRPRDAVTAAELLPAGDLREQTLELARAAVERARPF